MKKLLYIALVACTQFTTAQAATGKIYIDPVPQHIHLADFLKKKVTLPAGTLVLLETAESFPSDQLTIGKNLQFKVRMDVMAENWIAIPTGAIALGRVKALNTATFNSPAEVTIELQYVQAVDGQMIALNGNEQTIKGTYPGEGTAVEAGATITAQVMNTIEIKVK
ncbi:MAG: hypothetical protein KDD14_21730 [Saprospiraceae bacterium]|nr:hypothetical protein [Saprospiraceae bacterium]